MHHHTPVLLNEVVSAAAGRRRPVDATVGHGGHAAALLADGAEALLAIDRDPDAIATARARLADPRIAWINAPYASTEAVEAVTRFVPDFILLDLGVSSRQLDADDRGFSFRPGVPLDMRMGHSGSSAADLLNQLAEDQLAGVFHDYGDERRGRALAREVVRRRQRAPFATSDDFVNAIRKVLGPRSGPGDFARLFQAMRIRVNDELEGLEAALPAFRDALRPGGRLAVISYHSGEDRLVKQAFRQWADPCTCPPALPMCVCGAVPFGHAVTRKAIVPGDDEARENPRARSARLRVFEVTNAA